MNAPLFLCSLQNCGLAVRASNLLMADFFLSLKSNLYNLVITFYNSKKPFFNGSIRGQFGYNG